MIIYFLLIYNLVVMNDINKKEIIQILSKNNLTFCSAESITGGAFASSFVKIKGISNFFDGSFICYSNKYKYNILKVNKNIEIVSSEMANELSINSRKILGSNISISFTGNASSNGIESKLKGLSYISITNGSFIESTKYISKLNDRTEIINDTVEFGIEFFKKFLLKYY
ncbi:MAG: damage-inducible protein [Candidatus Tyloplasma litorale]|nr:MAG: damage-inducible protein [Mycoplasmatales bacterium]